VLCETPGDEATRRGDVSTLKRLAGDPRAD
jgi:hypothetical protein